jgi:rod shape-determining protein MreC
MRNLLVFVIRNNALFLFVLLQSFCFYLIIQNDNYHRAGFFNAANTVSGHAFSVYSRFTDYFSLKDVNEKLALENVQLRNQLKSDFFDTTSKRTRITDTANKQVYSYIVAKVVNVTVNSVNNFITINRGKKQGVDIGMAVIGPTGVVGIVKDVSDNFAVILPVINKDFHVSARVSRDNNLGNLEWKGISPYEADISDVPRQANVKKGDTIVTTGSSIHFPDNIPVGIVEKAELREGSNFYTIKLRLATSFSKLTYVYVVNDLMKNEQQKLEQKSAHD